MPSYGYAATVSWLIVIMVGILSWIQFQVAKDR
jgi:lactose/L-arabinose transport system permease protein